MTNEFNLSEKIFNGFHIADDAKVIRLFDVKEFIRLLKEKTSDVNKHLGLHNVDECECCEANWKCVYEILQIIDKLAGDRLI